jgi:hypothetical protein
LEKRLTYYIGAGASFHSMPLQTDMYERLDLFLRCIATATKTYADKQEIQNILNSFRRIINEVQRSTSYDAYAKELYDNNSLDLLRSAKVLLSSFFLFEHFNKEDVAIFDAERNSAEFSLMQKVKRQMDKRYRTFWGHIFNNRDRELPKSIRIISWNYDLQLEISHSIYTKLPLGDSINSLKIHPICKSEVPSIIKLNGTAGYFYAHNEPVHHISDFQYEDYNTNMKQLVDIIIAGCNKTYTQPYLNFAWEKSEFQKASIERAKEIIRTTTDLIIVGYSFPRFNREIDRQILGAEDNIKSVYYQTLAQDFPVQRENLRSVSASVGEKAKLTDSLDLFFIPSDF